MTDESNKSILVVEDELPLQKAVVQKFERKGMKVQSAKTVPEALAIMEHAGHVDLVWLDHYLIGKQTGLDFLKALKEKEDWSHIPVVLVSNTASLPMVREYQQNGINKAYIKSENSIEEICNDTVKMIG